MRTRFSPAFNRLTGGVVLISSNFKNMIAFAWLRCARRVTLSIVCLLLPATLVSGGPCDRIRTRPDAWIAFRVDALVRTARGAYLSDRGIRNYERVLDGITRTVRQCNLKDDNVFLKRYQVFVDYVETAALDRYRDHELGFIVDDEQYFAETAQFVKIPEYLLDQQFLRWTSRYETLPRAKRYLAELNSRREPAQRLMFFSYKSQHLGTPDNDNSFLRLLIVVPGNAAAGDPEKWVQFGVTDPGVRTRVRNVSVVSAVGAVNGNFNAYFKDFYRSYRRDGSITVKGRWELGDGDDNCTLCHKSGILPIFPAPGSVSKEEQATLLAVNDRFRSYGAPRFGRYLDAEKLGPGLSAATAASRRQRFGERFATTPVAGAMVCSSCHNANGLGALTWPWIEF
jgi:hypothetical protein